MTTEVLGISQTSACNGATTAFPVNFSFASNDELLVYLLDAATDPNTSGTLLVEGDDYTISGSGLDETASVNTIATYAAGKFIRRWRSSSRDQTADYVPDDGFPAVTHEAQLDRLSRVTEEQDEALGRAVRAPAGETALAELPAKADRASQLMAFDADGNPVVGGTDAIVTMLIATLVAGVGIELTPDVGAGTVTISSTVTGSGDADAWLLLSGVEGDPGTAADIRAIVYAALQVVGAVKSQDVGLGTITIDLTQDATAEVIRDVIGTALVAGNAITITPDDPGNSITIAVSTEAVQDMIASFLVAGPSIGLTYNDAGNALTVEVVSDTVTLLVTDPNGSALTAGDGKLYYRVPARFNGWNLSAVAASVSTVSSSGLPTIQLRRKRAGVDADMLSTKLTIDANELDSKDALTPAVINAANDDLATGDQINVDVDLAGTGTKGLIVEMTFTKP